MTLEILSTIVLSYFFLRYLGFAYESWRNGYARLWVGVTLLLAASLFIPLAAVWL